MRMLKGKRRFTKQMLEDEDLTGKAKGDIAKTLEYKKNTASIKEAAEIIEKVGLMKPKTS